MADLHYDNGHNTFQLSYRKAQSHHMPNSHFHSTYEIYYLMSGQRSFFIRDRTVAMEEGDVVIVSPNIVHRTINAALPEHERLIANIHPSYLGMSSESAGSTIPAIPVVLQPLIENEYLIVRLSLHDRVAIDELAEGMIREMREQKPGYEIFTQTLVQQLLILCCRYAGQGSTQSVAAPSAMHERISEIAQYINRHYMDDLSLQRVADQFYISPYYLSRFFKEATGFTFVEYLSSVRIKEAKKLLEQTPMKVSIIARKVGFGSVTHFGRVFKNVTGRAPLYYRNGR
ncbi:AraC-like protein [Paenibacillus cellulosilyticus]|uniref:AraC-like protein n=1 Tax=Paenibacillus cellulosilyticus TaxID=375489 RepID=A0A2V2YR81_9BACL|nr:AraC family transcriptional regulator [Paenibacillus cellulosilyticus]PWV99390.1 AraC-like protein [Paenibacillus cellulosilyticus]QKS45150.1 helix-turn-helix transcriptional regulator [Paenibacillus cellulosilyticus]